MSTSEDDESEGRVRVEMLASRLTRFRYNSSLGACTSAERAATKRERERSVAPSTATTPVKTESTVTPTPSTKSARTRQPKSSYFDAESDRDEFEPKLEDGDDVDMPSPSKKQKKKKKPARPYADPSMYAHLGGLTDILGDDMDVMICGINPGLQSAATHTHYAHPTNHYWKCLWKSGFTDRLFLPREGELLLEVAKMGMTNLIARPTAETSELSAQEKRDSVPVFLGKVFKHKPKVVAFTGMEICDVTLKFLHTLPRLDREVKLEQDSGSSTTTSDLAPQVKTESPYFAEPSSSASSSSLTTSRITPPAVSKKKRQKARPKTINGLQPVCISFPSSSSTGQELDDRRRRKVTYFVCLPSPSARVTTYQLQDKVDEFVKLKTLVQKIKQLESDDEIGEYDQVRTRLELADPKNDWVEHRVEELVERIKLLAA
ncbi:hypothetical protein ACM66B_006938 [Microbotryomycetes sp. NB124-2]